MDLQPDYIYPYVWMAYRHSYQGNIDSARIYIEGALSIDPDDFLALVAGGDVELLNGSYKEAHRFYERSVAVGGKTGESAYKLAYVLHALGKKGESESIASANLSAFATSFDRYPEGSHVPYYVAALFAWRADTTEANRWLRHAISLGYRDYRWISVDPQLEGIRATAQYQATMSSLLDAFVKMRDRALAEALGN
jgi:tetratricopeptide (TPR) repeat protein